MKINLRTPVITLASVISLAITLTSTTVLAEGDAVAGRLKSETCIGCHAVPNMENTYPMYRVPKVAGQHAPYIAAALKAYQDGSRPHKTMHANADGLSDQDIQDIAAYFSSLK